jgi:hypothetical protein
MEGIPELTNTPSQNTNGRGSRGLLEVAAGMLRGLNWVHTPNGPFGFRGQFQYALLGSITRMELAV